MSQTRTHKAERKLSSKKKNTAVQVTTAKAVDEFHIQNESRNEDLKRSRSKNKIPKSVRVDLENALVGLCNVWFEEIKPHLVRNNIKLHVPGAGAGCASGDYEHQLSRNETKCAHLDPGAARDLPQHTIASYAGSCLMPSIALKVPCLKLSKPNRQQGQTLEQPRLSHRLYVPNPDLKYKEIRPQKQPKFLRKRRSSQFQAHSNWRVPRLCRTYSLIPSFGKQSLKSSTFDDTYERYLAAQRHRKITVGSKSTQTELSIPTGHVLSVTTQTHFIDNRPYAALLSGSHSFKRRKGITLLSSLITRQKFTTSNKDRILFQDDLIDIIGEKHDKRIKIIYNSPEQVVYPSLMNLVSPSDRLKKSISPKKIPPWR